MSDLESLIAAAKDEQLGRKEKAHSKSLEKGGAPARRFSLLLWVALIPVLSAVVYLAAVPFLPVSEDVVRGELNAALDAAQSSVEQFRKEKGKLPDRVPATALANLVHYEATGDGYRLSASVGGITASRQY